MKNGAVIIFTLCVPTNELMPEKLTKKAEIDTLRRLVVTQEAVFLRAIGAFVRNGVHL